jgi:hypothetical protein
MRATRSSITPASFSPLARPAGHEIVEGFAGERQTSRHGSLDIDAVVAEDTRPAQHIVDRQRSGERQDVPDLRIEATEPFEQAGVYTQLFRLRGRWCETDPAFELASTKPRANQFAQLRFDDAQFVAHPKVAIEVARIDALQLDVQGSALDGARPGGITGHAVNHRNPDILTIVYQLPALQSTPKNRTMPETLNDSPDTDGATSEPPPPRRFPDRRILH